MALDEILISRAIIQRFTEKLLDNLELDVAVVGGGVSGLTAAWRLAQRGHKVAIFERKLSIGGGMWGGGMMFNEIVIQEAAKPILDELGIRVRPIFDRLLYRGRGGSRHHPGFPGPESRGHRVQLYQRGRRHGPRGPGHRPGD